MVVNCCPGQVQVLPDVRGQPASVLAAQGRVTAPRHAAVGWCARSGVAVQNRSCLLAATDRLPPRWRRYAFCGTATSLTKQHAY